MRVAVVGSGVIGLTSAIRLHEAGHEVTIFAREQPPQTTSDVAAAFWYPSGDGHDRLSAWCAESLEVFRALARDPGAGVEPVRLFELADRPFRNPALELAGDLQAADPAAFPHPWKHGYGLTVPRIEVPTYMPFLDRRFRVLGGRFEPGTVAHLDDLAGCWPLVVNCAGLGAKDLAPDPGVHPIRGQIVRIRRPPALPSDIVHIDVPGTRLYIVPRREDCILGGSYQVGDGDLEPDEALARTILERTSAFHPALRGPEVLEHRVGLRPGRETVRLEAEPGPGGSLIVHNYGHGSIGHTLSWGCAAEVCALVTDPLEGGA